MTKINPYLAEIRSRSRLEDLATEYLATLAIAHELREANSLTEAINAPPRFVANSQNPIAPEELRAEMAKTKIRAVPDDSGDARIAAAARRWGALYALRRSPTASGAALGLAAAQLAEAIRQEDER